MFQVRQAADESPATPELADRQHQLVATLPQWKVDGVVFGVDDAKEPGVVESSRQPAYFAAELGLRLQVT